MKTPTDTLYNFAFRGLMAEEALDRQGRRSRLLNDQDDHALAESLGLPLLDDELVINAKQMSLVYTAIAAFENSVRTFVSKRLQEDFHENWWEEKVSKGIRERAATRMEDERRTRWHAQRGQDPINYTTLSDLSNIMHNNAESFTDYISNIEWARSIFDVIERSRNVIMHSSVLDQRDIERLGINMRDWIKQVGV